MTGSSLALPSIDRLLVPAPVGVHDNPEKVELVDVDNTVPFNLVVRVDDRNEVFARMKAAGIGVGVHYPPNHTQHAFQRWHRRLPDTEASTNQLLSLPFHPAMTEADVTTVVDALATALPRC
ncbi:DegT/DnrJ/EryC1/StrS family aminotransferase [Nocardia cyriacigeorgica]|uniref:DegT/DnrJ/EryC1/StrS family aminotransferase n=1 Tax=Nocardia cyriacigeorgica TaxID=135487 RepID=UPI001485FB26|nr:DegT/DnrJ/EryC1/StrS family aminotransferase [Nocardia cyriacigeorgica]